MGNNSIQETKEKSMLLGIMAGASVPRSSLRHTIHDRLTHEAECHLRAQEL